MDESTHRVSQDSGIGRSYAVQVTHLVAVAVGVSAVLMVHGAAGMEARRHRISGIVDYLGGQPGRVIVQAFATPDFRGAPAGKATTYDFGGRLYEVAGLPTGEYWLRAFRDVDGDGVADDGEAQGECAANPVRLEQSLAGVAITMLDPDDGGDTGGGCLCWGFVTVTSVPQDQPDQGLGNGVDESREGADPPTTIYVDCDASGGDTGVSWQDAFVDLQDALTAARDALAAPVEEAPDLTTPCIEVWVAEGTYRPTADTDRTASFVLFPGVALYGGFGGGEMTKENRDWRRHPTVLSGDIGTTGFHGDNSYHVVDTPHRELPFGWVLTALLGIDGFVVTGGCADGLEYPGNSGGGMYSKACSPRIENCLFVGNSATRDGGGLYTGSSGAAVSDCIFADNAAEDGGAVFSEEETGRDDTVALSPTFTRCAFIGNRASRWGGGGADFESRALFTACSFIRNVAKASGGGVGSRYMGEPRMASCLFLRNEAPTGAALWSQGASLRLTNCTVYGNRAGDAGGAVAVEDYSRSGALALTNCILWGNTAERDAGIHCADGAAAPTVSSSCVQGWVEGGTGNVDADPLFLDGQWHDLRLLDDSPCVDSGQASVDVPVDDLLGCARDADPDMGAYEHAAARLAGITVTGVEVAETAGVVLVELRRTGPVDGDCSVICTTLDGTAENGTDYVGSHRVVTWNAGEAVKMFEVPVLDDSENETDETVVLMLHDVQGAVVLVGAALLTILDDESDVIHVDARADGASDGVSWSDAFPYLDEALVVARPGDEIWVAAGDYSPPTATVYGETARLSFTLREGVAVYGGFAGDETTRHERDWRANVTVLAAGPDGPPARSIWGPWPLVLGADDAVLDGFTIWNTAGCGMQNENVSSEVANCTFDSNPSGAMSNRNASVEVVGCVFSENSGPAVVNRDSHVLVQNCVFRGNVYGGGGGWSPIPLPGGAAMENYDSEAAVVNSVFFANSIGSARRVLMRGTTGGDGRGRVPSTPEGTRPGIPGDPGGGPVPPGSVIPGPSIPDPGQCFPEPQGTAGVYSERSELVLTNCTFAANWSACSGGDAGAVYSVSSSTTMTNCILWGNRSLDDCEIYSDPESIAAVSCSCVEAGRGGTREGNIAEDPLFADPTDPDGPDDRFGTADDGLHLTAGSPCIDAGDGTEAPPTDIGGRCRLDDPDTSPNAGVGRPDYADIGCHEYWPDGKFPLELASGWNLVSVPLTLAAPAVGDVFRDVPVVGSVWGWGDSGYERATALEPGRGYWVFLVGARDEGVRIELEGHCERRESAVAFSDGWNLFGPLAAITPADIPGHRQRAQGPVWGWDADVERYRAIGVDGLLACGKAYWLFWRRDPASRGGGRTDTSTAGGPRR